MKKSSLQSLVNYLNEKNDDYMMDIKAEIEAELNRGAAKAEANRNAYAEMREKVIQALSVASSPVTAQELSEETGIARGKIVYGLTHYWADEIVKDTTGKATTYSLV